MYVEVAQDARRNREAVALVLLAGLASAAGRLPEAADESGAAAAVLEVGLALAGTVLAWLVSAGVLYLVGTRLLGGNGSYGFVWRATAYAYLPNLLDALRWVPTAGGLLYYGGGVWSLVLLVVALRAVLGLGIGAAIALCVFPFALAVLGGLVTTVAKG